MARKLYASCEYFLSGDQFIMLGHQKRWARSTDTALCWTSFVCLDCKLNHHNSYCTWQQRKLPLSGGAVQAFIGSTPYPPLPSLGEFYDYKLGRFHSRITVKKFLNNRFWRGRRTEKAKLQRKITGVRKNIIILGNTWAEKGRSVIYSYNRLSLLPKTI